MGTQPTETKAPCTQFGELPVRLSTDDDTYNTVVLAANGVSTARIPPDADGRDGGAVDPKDARRIWRGDAEQGNEDGARGRARLEEASQPHPPRTERAVAWLWAGRTVVVDWQHWRLPTEHEPLFPWGAAAARRAMERATRVWASIAKFGLVVLVSSVCRARELCGRLTTARAGFMSRGGGDVSVGRRDCASGS